MEPYTFDAELEWFKQRGLEAIGGEEAMCLWRST
jgi:hypothetical protein